MAGLWDLPVAFYFSVFIGGIELPFKEVSGLSTEMETENIGEGGVNDFEHKLPKQIKQRNLVLKRALAPVSSNDVKWIKQWLECDFSTFFRERHLYVCCECLFSILAIPQNGLSNAVGFCFH
jgi:phage tail-like protein